MTHVALSTISHPSEEQTTMPQSTITADERLVLSRYFKDFADQWTALSFDHISIHKDAESLNYAFDTEDEAGDIINVPSILRIATLYQYSAILAKKFPEHDVYLNQIDAEIRSTFRSLFSEHRDQLLDGLGNTAKYDMSQDTYDRLVDHFAA